MAMIWRLVSATRPQTLLQLSKQAVIRSLRSREISSRLIPCLILSDRDGSGTWTLAIEDLYPTADGGQLNSWYIEICGALATEMAVLLTNEILEVPNGLSETVTQSFLEADGTPGSVVFTLLSIPNHGILDLDGVNLGIGGQFTQQDVNDGKVNYTHDGSATMSDDFTFDVLEDGAKWLHNQLFQINIIENSIIASAALTQGIDCHDENDAIITVSANGGVAPLEYSLNGGAYQTNPVFENLSAGIYTITVRDANGLTVGTNTIEVENPSAISLSTTVNDNDLTINASGGTGNLEYSLDGTNYQSSNEFLDLANGSYTVYVRDENGCIETTIAVVAVNTVYYFLDHH